MRFLTGFLKTAALDFNTQGREYKLEDAPAPYAAGAAGMAPTGIPTYDPKGVASEKQKKPSTLKGDSILIAMSKMSAAKFAFGPEGSYASGCDGVGTSGQSADTIADQLKYESSHNAKPEYFGYDKNRGAKYRRYLRALHNKGNPT